MSVDDFRRSVDYLLSDVFPRLGWGVGNHISVQYVGGEILLIPPSHLQECVFHLRDALMQAGFDVKDGVQTNLIGGENRVLSLSRIFGVNIGTSIDRFTRQRTLAGSWEKYQEVLSENLSLLKRRRNTSPSAILVVDRHSLPHLKREMELAEEEGRHLVLRPVFQGGSHVAPASLEDMAAGFEEAFRYWVGRSPIMIEPFGELLSRRIHPSSCKGSCPFQNDCATRSLDLEPNGDLYTCLDMADSQQGKLGNAILETFNEEVWRLIGGRASSLPDDCQVCQWRVECQGGCMSEAMHAGNPYGKTPFCLIWKRLFQCMDDVLQSRRQEIERWRLLTFQEPITHT